jgi:hypothetical protein
VTAAGSPFQSPLHRRNDEPTKEQNMETRSVIVLIVLIIAAFLGLAKSDMISSAERIQITNQQTKQFTTCIEKGGSWIAGNCINPPVIVEKQ